MRKSSPVVLSVGVSLLLAVGSSCNDLRSSPRPGAVESSSAIVTASASAHQLPGRVPRRTQPAPKPEEVTLKVDGAQVVGSLWADPNPTAPAVILVHRGAGNRSEWWPLVERLLPTKYPMHLLAFDLRGHGHSASKKLAWQTFDNQKWEDLTDDAVEAVNLMQKRKGGPPQGVVLVGSDIGATLAIRAVSKTSGHVLGVAMVSPGASLRGIDLYVPFGAVLSLPNLVQVATTDNVSRDPALLLPKMSKSTEVLRYEAVAHGAQALGEARWEMWDDLAKWVEARVAPADESAPPVMLHPTAAPSAPPSAASPPAP